MWRAISGGPSAEELARAGVAAVQLVPEDEAARVCQVGNDE